MKKNKVYNLGIGTTSLLIIFIVVCLTILSVLSYMVTNTDYKITEIKTEYNSGYHKADSKAIEKMAQIDEILYKIASKNMKFNGTKAKLMMATIDEIEVNYSSNEISYDVPIRNSAYLSVVLKVNIDKEAKLPRIMKATSKKGKTTRSNSEKENRITIKKWQLVNKSEEIEDTITNLWTNE